jgi:hypothetical protein
MISSPANEEDFPMADVAQQLLEAMESLDEVADSMTAHDAVEQLDEATLQVFWRDWPRIQSWAGSLWRCLNDEMAETASPAGGDVDTGGGD